MATSELPFPKLILQHSKLLVALACVITLSITVLSVTRHLTADQIERNEQAWLEAQINVLVPAAMRDNDLLKDRTTMTAPEFFASDSPAIIYRARRNGLPVAAVIRSITNEGYGGPIELLVAVNYDGEVMGVRILSHHETPGIGNVFELPQSHWLQQFTGRSLQNPSEAGWDVHKSGGQFEQFTSATITPHAIIKAVQHTLDFYQHRRDEIYLKS